MEHKEIKAIKDETPSVLKAAWLIALVTIASKFMGFVRDMVVANFYGATLVSDASCNNYIRRSWRSFPQCCRSSFF